MFRNFEKIIIQSIALFIIRTTDPWYINSFFSFCYVSHKVTFACRSMTTKFSKTDDQFVLKADKSSLSGVGFEATTIYP